MNIYLRFLTPVDITRKIMDIVIASLRETTRFHEMKMFLIHQHFDFLSIKQMNDLVDTFMEILSRPNFKKNYAKVSLTPTGRAGADARRCGRRSAAEHRCRCAWQPR